MILDFNGKEITITEPIKRYWQCTSCRNTFVMLPRHCECGRKNFCIAELGTHQELITWYLENIEILKIDIKNLILEKEKQTATEYLCETAKQKYPFYTTRHDDLEEVWTFENGIYVPQGKTYIKQFCRTILEKNYTENIANQVIAKIETDTFISAETFFENKYPEKIVCENGVINLKTKQFESFNPKEIQFTKIPIMYDENAKCPNIHAFLFSTLETAEDVQAFYELAGYCLWKENFLNLNAMFLGPREMTANGSNGKTSVLNVLRTFLGAKNVKGIPLQQFEKNLYAESELFGKLANLAGDISDTPLRDLSKFKTLTGEESSSAPRKFKESLELSCYAKMVFSANKLPKTKDLTKAFFRRWLVFRFPYTFDVAEQIEILKRENNEEFVKNFKVKDPEIVKKTITQVELSGLLNESLRGIAKIRENKSFTTSKTSEAIKKMWVRESDSFLAFAWENIESNPEERIEAGILHREYQKFCRANRLMPVGPKWCAQILNEQFGAIQGDIRTEVGHQRVWEGISFIAEKRVWNSLKGDEVTNLSTQSTRF